MNNSPKTWHGVEKIVSGGQTGVDRGALDAAIELGIAHGGWCPRGRIAEDGRIAERYELVELDSPDYAARTLQNVIDSDGTLILYRERLQGGTALTNRLAKEQQKPLKRVRIDRPVRFESVIDWLIAHQIQVLNVAGPRGSSHPNLEGLANSFLKKLFSSTGQLPNLDGSPAP